jgi:hypothetical protein
MSDTKIPFCFHPDTISSEAKAFLASRASGGTPFDSSDTSREGLAAILQQVREFYRAQQAPFHDKAVKQHLQSVRNSSIGGVPVVIGVPKGVTETLPANTKVLMYLHGELCSVPGLAQCFGPTAGPHQVP